MSEFQFRKSQRVLLPVDITGAEGIWGVVTGNHAALGREPFYDLQWQSADTVYQTMLLVTHTATIAESRLLAAQPPKMVPVIEAEKMAQEAFCQGGECERVMIRKEREARAAKRKPTSRKRKR